MIAEDFPHVRRKSHLALSWRSLEDSVARRSETREPFTIAVTAWLRRVAASLFQPGTRKTVAELEQTRDTPGIRRPPLTVNRSSTRRAFGVGQELVERGTVVHAAREQGPDTPRVGDVGARVDVEEHEVGRSRSCFFTEISALG